jgi:MFS family permease
VSGKVAHRPGREVQAPLDSHSFLYMSSSIWRIIAAVFVGMLGFGAVIPMLPVYLHEEAGASPFLVGLLIGLSSALALLGRLGAGQMADRNGRRPTLLLGMAFCAVAGVLYLPFGLWTIALARVLHGLGEGFFVTATVAWVVDLAPATRRAQAMGFLSSATWGGLSLGPAVGQALGSVTRVALLLTISSIAVIAMIFAMYEDPRPHHHEPSRWFPRPVVTPGILLGLGNVAYAAMAGFLMLLLRHRGQGTSWAFSLFALAVLFGRVTFGSLPDRQGPRRSLFAGYVCLAIGLAAIAVSDNPVIDIAASLLVGLGYSFPWPALASLVVSRVRVSERASALAALNTFYDVFVAGSSAVAGAAAQRWGLAAPFWLALASVATAASLVLVTGIGTEPWQPSEQAPTRHELSIEGAEGS